MSGANYEFWQRRAIRPSTNSSAGELISSSPSFVAPTNSNLHDEAGPRTYRRIHRQSRAHAPGDARHEPAKARRGARADASARAEMRSGHTSAQRLPVVSDRKRPENPAGLLLRRRAASPAVSQHRRPADAGFTVHLSHRSRGLRVAQILPAHKISEDAALHSCNSASYR